MSEAQYRKRIRRVCDELVWAGMDLKPSISLKSRFVGKEAIERELDTRGYRLTQDTKGFWFAEDRGQAK